MAGPFASADYYRCRYHLHRGLQYSWAIGPSIPLRQYRLILVTNGVPHDNRATGRPADAACHCLYDPARDYFIGRHHRVVAERYAVVLTLPAGVEFPVNLKTFIGGRDSRPSRIPLSVVSETDTAQSDYLARCICDLDS